MACEEKSNEITAIPKLLELLQIKGCIVTIDAMGTQTKIAEKIIEKGGDYLLPVKENQRQLHSDIELFFQTEGESIALAAKAEETMTIENGVTITESANTASTSESSHGRIEARSIVICNDVAWLDPENRWKELSGIAMLTATRQKVGSDEVQSSVKYLIYSMKAVTAKQILFANREHWGVENGLHWSLDVSYNEDNCRARAGNAGIIFNLMRHLSLNLLSQEKTSKGGVKTKSLRCALSNAYLERVLGIS